MKNILFPTDFSANAQNAYAYALHLADKLNATITTLHVYSPPMLETRRMPNTINQLVEEDRQNDFKQYQEAAQQMHERAATEALSNVHVSHDLVEGQEVDELIIQTAQKEKADLIVMGTKGATGLREIFMGSVTAKVIENATCPVLAIPENASYKPIRKIAYATDFEALEEAVLAQAIDFAQFLESETHCIHINTAHTYAAESKMKDWGILFAGKQDVHFHVLEGSDVIKGINDYMHQNDIDVLAMLTHRRTFLGRIFLVSYTERMAFHTDTPLLAFHEKSGV